MIKYGVPVCMNCEKPLSPEEQAKFAIICNACAKRFLAEIAPNIGIDKQA
jgi:DNA-directed RNA polymerase subunit RPC12/RpoP